MREILFRGKRVDNGERVEGSLVLCGDRKYIFPSNGVWQEDYCINVISEVDLKTVGQYTGLKDKNGKKIFEGDILKTTDLYDEPLLVEFNEHCAAFQVTFRDGYSEGFLERYSNINHIEIIGNIHDNPELLKR